MQQINYTHLHYFWTVAREGSVTQAARVLHLTPQTVSGQIKLLERRIGEPLLRRVGRGLQLTSTGEFVKHYADDIFALGSELTQRLSARDPEKNAPLRIGILNSIAKLVAYRIVAPASSADDRVPVLCREGDLETLMSGLAVHRLDMVLSDRPIPPGFNVKAFNHSLGESGVSLFAATELAERLAPEFPGSLNDAPLLLPIATSALRIQLDDWLDRLDISPQIVGEFEDSALLKAFGEAGTGVFPAPTVIADEVEYTYHARRLGEVQDAREHYYAISPQRKLAHPAVLKIAKAARTGLLSPQARKP